jgi:hypothetical protein
MKESGVKPRSSSLPPGSSFSRAEDQGNKDNDKSGRSDALLDNESSASVEDMFSGRPIIQRSISIDTGLSNFKCKSIDETLGRKKHEVSDKENGAAKPAVSSKAKNGSSMTKSPCRKIHEKSVNAIYCIFSE